MKTRPSSAFIAALLGPPLLVYAIFVLLPAFNAVRFSFTRWDGLSEPKWVGMKNYREITTGSADFITSLQHNGYLMVTSGVFILGLALFFAYTLHRGVKGGRIFRIAFFFPNVISFVAISLLWIFIYSPTEVGLLNAVLKWFAAHGIPLTHEKLPIPFLQSSRLLTAIPAMMVWSATGFYLVLFLAAMENIPETYYEAAKLEGASDSRMFRFITLPLMWDVLTTGIVYLVIGGLKIFDSVWIMDNGRPSKDSHTLATLMYSKVFEEYNIGYGTAIAVCLFLLVLLATQITFRVLRRERLEY